MAKIFTKLNLADIVATSGGKSFRQLSTESGGGFDDILSPDDYTITNLSRTTWYIREGWKAAEAEVMNSSMSINGILEYEGQELEFTVLDIGYTAAKTSSTSYDFSPKADSIAFVDTYSNKGYINVTNGKPFEVRFFGGYPNNTYSPLINWLKTYGVLDTNTVCDSSSCSGSDADGNGRCDTCGNAIVTVLR